MEQQLMNPKMGREESVCSMDVETGLRKSQGKKNRQLIRVFQLICTNWNEYSKMFLFPLCQNWSLFLSTRESQPTEDLVIENNT